MIHKKVKFQNNTYWLHESDTGQGYLLSPLDHYDEAGNLLADTLAYSYAVVENDNRIMRYGNHIGYLNDLVDVND